MITGYPIRFMDEQFNSYQLLRDSDKCNVITRGQSLKDLMNENKLNSIECLGKQNNEQEEIEEKIKQLKVTYESILFEFMLYQEKVIKGIFKEFKINCKTVLEKLSSKGIYETIIEQDNAAFIRGLFGCKHKQLNNADQFMSYWECDDFTQQIQPQFQPQNDFKFTYNNFQFKSSLELLRQLLKTFSVIVIEIPVDDQLSPFSGGCFSQILSSNKVVVMQYTRKTVTLLIINQMSLKQKIDVQRPQLKYEIEQIEHKNLFRYQELLQIINQPQPQNIQSDLPQSHFKSATSLNCLLEFPNSDVIALHDESLTVQDVIHSTFLYSDCQNRDVVLINYSKDNLCEQLLVLSLLFKNVCVIGGERIKGFGGQKLSAGSGVVWLYAVQGFEKEIEEPKVETELEVEKVEEQVNIYDEPKKAEPEWVQEIKIFEPKPEQNIKVEIEDVKEGAYTKLVLPQVMNKQINYGAKMQCKKRPEERKPEEKRFE